MTDYREIEQRLREHLNPTSRPVAMAFRATAPEGVSVFVGTEPSSCSFWRLAASGRTFCTVPGDHFNCPIGSYTHNVPLPAGRAHELDDVLGLMAQMGYLGMDEVPGIPRLPETPGVIVYAPLGGTPVDPDVVIVAARPGRLMLLHEAAVRAGVPASAPMFGRPTCMAVPAALSMGVVSSVGCVGNRVYTDLPEDQLYVTIPGRDLARVADELTTIGQANETLLSYHRVRREELRGS
jgi:uncharacterized protein (DUF169 family)